jgi:hypothetical protein
MLDRYAPDNPRLRQSWGVDIEGTLDTAVLERALLAMRERHAILRSRLVEADGELWQEVLDDLDVPVLERVDLSSLDGAAQQQAVADFHQRIVVAPFALARGEVMRAGLATLSPRRHRFVVALHRTVCDSAAIFIDELTRIWCALSEDPGRRGSEVLPPLAFQYVDLADYLDRMMASRVGAEHRAFWQQQLAGAAPLELPVDAPRDAIEARRRETDGWVTFPAAMVSTEIDRVRLEAIERLARRERATVQATLLAGLAAHLGERSGQHDLAFVSHLTYRHVTGFERALGLFANPLVVRISTENVPSFRGLVRRTHEVLMNAFEHGEYDVIRDASYPLYRLWFNYMVPRAGEGEPQLPAGLAARTVPLPRGGAGAQMYDLTLRVQHYADQLVLDLLYNRELFRESSAKALLLGYVARVVASCSEPDAD